MGFDAARYYSSKKKSFNWKPFRRRQEFLELLLHVLITHSSTFVYFVIPNNLWTLRESLRQLQRQWRQLTSFLFNFKHFKQAVRAWRDVVYTTWRNESIRKLSSLIYYLTLSFLYRLD